MTETDDYDDELRSLMAAGADVEEAYWQLVVGDIQPGARVSPAGPRRLRG